MSAVVRDAFPRPTLPRAGARRRRARWRFALIVVLVVVAGAYAAARIAHRDEARRYLAGGDWPVAGQAALVVGAGTVESRPDQQPVPIASVAKGMTAYVVLRDEPLPRGADGFELTVTAADVADTAARGLNDESIVAVNAGEVLTERQALV